MRNILEAFNRISSGKVERWKGCASRKHVCRTKVASVGDDGNDWCLAICEQCITNVVNIHALKPIELTIRCCDILWHNTEALWTGLRPHNPDGLSPLWTACSLCLASWRMCGLSMSLWLQLNLILLSQQWVVQNTKPVIFSWLLALFSHTNF
jgi:hypothetical protein